MFLLRDKLILQGEKRETSTKNLKRNNVARQVMGFCIPYFAAFREFREFKKTTTATSCGTPQNNGVNEQNNETARAKYKLFVFSANNVKSAFSKF